MIINNKKLKLLKMIKKNENWGKRALEDSLFTWIVAFSVIVFIMILYSVFTLAVFGKEKLTSDSKIIFEESNVNLNLNKKFLNFLNSKIITENNKEEKIIDSIKSSLDGYFEIENDKGESFVSKYGLIVIMEEGVALKNKMISEGFDEDDWNKIIDANLEIQKSGKIDLIIKELDKICKIDNKDNYYLEITQGSITNVGFRVKEAFNPENSYYYLQPLIHKTNYKGESFEIKLRLRKECLN